MYICLCKGLTERDVRRAGQSGHTSEAALIRVLGLDDRSCCGRCARDIEYIVALAEDEWVGARRARTHGVELPLHPGWA